MQINISMYLIREPSGAINFWSISDSESQAWEDYREWFRESEEGVFKYCDESTVLKSQGYSCIRVDSIGEVLP